MICGTSDSHNIASHVAQTILSDVRDPSPPAGDGQTRMHGEVELAFIKEFLYLEQLLNFYFKRFTLLLALNIHKILHETSVSPGNRKPLSRR